MSFHAVAGVAAGTLSLLAVVPYVLAIFGRSISFRALPDPTRPSRVTWIVLSSVSLILLGTFRASGATAPALWLPAALTFSTVTVAILSIWHGQGGLRPSDLLGILGAIAAVLIWIVASIPESALLTACAAEFCGLLPTIEKSWRTPQSESPLAWIIALIASGLNLLAVDTWSLSITSYPLYLFVSNGLVVALLLWPRAKLSAMPARLPTSA